MIRMNPERIFREQIEEARRRASQEAQGEARAAKPVAVPVKLKTRPSEADERRIDERRRESGRHQVAGILRTLETIGKQAQQIARNSRDRAIPFADDVLQELYRVRRHVQLAAFGQNAALPPVAMLSKGGGEMADGAAMPQMGIHTTVHQPCVFLAAHKIKLGNRVRIDSFVKIEGGEGVTIERYVHVASFCHLNIGGGALDIREGAAFASGAKVITGSNSPEGESCSASAPEDQQVVTRSRVTIHRNAFICTNAVVLPGVTIGEHAVLAAGAVATQDIPPFEIWGGVPARKIGAIGRDATPEEISAELDRVTGRP
jgi:acetyltransferase-like isoleucine patch superfamily enzyme